MSAQATCPDVFLSYSHKDGEVVEQMAGLLSNEGFTCWIDSQRLRAAEKFNSAIMRAIDDCIVFIAFLSRTYVTSGYCGREMDRAIDQGKCIMTVCLDDVTERTNRKSAYMFAFSAGRHVLGLGRGMEGVGGPDAFAREISRSVVLDQLRRYRQTDDEAHRVPVASADYLLARLRQYHEGQYEQRGSLAPAEISADLFPALRNVETNARWSGGIDRDMSLDSLVQKPTADGGHHMLITGEGGAGKTIALLRLADRLMDDHVNAIYVPLSKIDASLTLDAYLERVVCAGNAATWGDLKRLMSVETEDGPCVVLLLDGVNEMPTQYVKQFVDSLATLYVADGPGVRVVLTSRWLDHMNLGSIERRLSHLEMLPLRDQTVREYLARVGLDPVTDRRMLSVLATPFMLTMYAHAEQGRTLYADMPGIELESHPDTPAKVLGNFFQTQLHRAAREGAADLGEHLVVLEYLLPVVAARMVQADSMHLDQREITRAEQEIQRECSRYQWYKWDRLSYAPGVTSDAMGSFLTRRVAVGGLHFLREVDHAYEFSHPIFRDYFAACALAAEVRALALDPARASEAQLLLEQCAYPRDVLHFAADMLKERNARPYLAADGYHTPGKGGCGPSSESVVEGLLDLWRGKEGCKAQNAIANILGIMRIGRRKELSWCDFSRLDLRKCYLNGCHFTGWHKEQAYPSTFDGAILDRSNLLPEGHDAPICAMAFDGRDRLFTGDMRGVVRHHNMTDHVWGETIRLRPDAVVDLAWTAAGDTLAILYEDIAYLYSVPEKAVVGTYPNTSGKGSFRYVRFVDGALQFAFAPEPLLWHDRDFAPLPMGLRFDVPARCASWRPGKSEFARSCLLQMLSVVRQDEATGRWDQHPALRSHAPTDDVQSLPTDTRQFLWLRQAGAPSSGSVSCLRYSPDGSRLLVGIGNMLIEYDAESLVLLNRKEFQHAVGCACYFSGGVAVATGTALVFMDEEFTLKTSLRSQIRPISAVLEDFDHQGFYVFSSNGEVKKLDEDLRVRAIRNVGAKCATWAHDRLTGEPQMVFPSLPKYPNGARYTYETNRTEPLGWRYELAGPSSSRWTFHRLGTTLMVIERNEPYRRLTYTNCAGVWIFGCSFAGVRGDMAQPRNLDFLQQNGGLI